MVCHRALRSRKGKAISRFKERYSYTKQSGERSRPVSPEQFLRLDWKQLDGVEDMSKRDNRSPLNERKIATATARAKRIMEMRPTKSELRAALEAAILERLR